MNPSNLEPLIAYITTSSRDEAHHIGKCLVEEQWAGCVNILPGMESLYVWKGVLEQAQECVLIAKTNHSCKEGLMNRVLELHSYECPCVLFIPVSDGLPAYLDWLREGTRSLP